MSSLAFLLTTSPSWLLATHLRTTLSNTPRACALSSPVGAAVVLALARHGLQEEEGAAGQQHAVRGGVLRRHADLDTHRVDILEVSTKVFTIYGVQVDKSSTLCSKRAFKQSESK